MMRPGLGAAVAVSAVVLVLLLPNGGSTSSAPLRLPTNDLGSVSPFVVPSHATPLSGPRCSGSSFCPFGIRTAYNFTSVLQSPTSNGSGQTIVIVDACGDRHIAGDLATFDAQFHLPNASLNVTPYGPGTTCTNGLWSIETALDVEWAHALAPGAAIDLLVTSSGNTSTIYGAWGYAIANHLGDQISNSWGGPGGCGPRIQSNLSKAAAAGITVLASSGDAGAYGTGTFRTPQNPADCQGVVAVGGTSLTVGPRDVYVSESAWSGSGGGYIGGLTEPKFERKANITDPKTLLAKPDVAADANPATGVWIYDSGRGGWMVLGGTSVACPLWAALIADTNSYRAYNGLGPLGTLDPYLYVTLYGGNVSRLSYLQDLHDVTTGSNGWAAGSGWDAATGLGSMDAGPFVNDLGTDPTA